MDIVPEAERNVTALLRASADDNLKAGALTQSVRLKRLVRASADEV